MPIRAELLRNRIQITPVSDAAIGKHGKQILLAPYKRWAAVSPISVEVEGGGILRDYRQFNITLRADSQTKAITTDYIIDYLDNSYTVKGVSLRPTRDLIDLLVEGS